MTDDTFRVLELVLQGFNCSQILAILALDALGREDPMVVRAMSGLVGGMGCGKTCGTLTGACCVLGLYAGRGTADTEEAPELSLMLAELNDWFDAEFGGRFGGTTCDDITGKDPGLRLERCPQMITDTFRKIADLLVFHGFSPASLSRGENE
ncbi:MAG: C_GCAxxG_C_C family protein [Telmatospirillum sp.]|nr:C_GCAxxG_C_C family protein [Telmatospirillum sp.]